MAKCCDGVSNTILHGARDDAWTRGAYPLRRPIYSSADTLQDSSSERPFYHCLLPRAA